MAHTRSAATAGDTYIGTPEMVRAVGCVGSGDSSGMLDPAVPNCFNVDSVSAVAGLVTKLVISVCKVSAADFAASKLSRVAQLPPLGAVDVVSEPSPDGPLAVVAVKYAASIFGRKSLTNPWPTTPNAAGLESFAIALLITTRTASFLGVIVSSSSTAS